MTENQPEYPTTPEAPTDGQADAGADAPTHQDPAETNQVDTAVETSEQPEPTAEAAEQPKVAPTSVTVAPGQPEVRNVHGSDYTVTPEQGYRKN